MILIRKYGWVAFLFLPFFASAQCLIPGFDDLACANQNWVDGCGTWTPPCGAGWTRSHGTPQMVPYTTPKGFTRYQAFMWVQNSSGAQSGVTTGEGMFYSLPAGNTFLANHTYNITFDVVASGGNNGRLNFYATNTLQQSNLNACGSALPNPNPRQLIGTFAGANNVWVLSVTLTFVANANYNQLWIYPSTGDGNQYSVAMKYLSACENLCPATIVYNTGVVPAGTSRAGKITAGTGVPGTAVVTVQPTQTTLFTADEVDLVANFEAVVTTGSFTATTGGCAGRPKKDPNREDYDPPFNPVQEYVNTQITDKSNLSTKQEIIPKGNSRIRVYPTLSTGIVNVAGMVEPSFTVSIFDQSGKKVLSYRNASRTDVTRLDLSKLSNGLYHIQIKNSFGTTNKKVIICR